MMRRVSKPAGWWHRRVAVAAALALAALAAVAGTRSASAADNPYQRGPDPTVASIAATFGPFATAQITVSPGNGFNGGFIYYPTDTSLGKWGAVAIVPGFSALFANEEAWMGPRLASFGFVVIGVETLSRSDGADARATEALAALDYLTQKSAVRDRVDPDRLSVMGHSAGGAGALTAALQRSSLKTVVGLAPGAPGNGLNLANLHMPTMFLGGQNDPTVTPAYLSGLWNTLPATTQRAWVEIAGADHLFFTRANNTEGRLLVPWLKTFLDNDTRYPQFMCPRLADMTGISNYRNSCPLVPPDGGSPSSPPTSPSSAPPTPTGGPVQGGQLVGEQSNRCVTAPNQNAGTQVQLQDCAARSGQVWTYTASRQLQASGLCLDANGGGTSNGTAVIVWSCNGQSNQQWNVNADGTVTGGQSGLCLDANGAGTTSGTKIILWSCNGQPNQRWNLRG